MKGEGIKAVMPFLRFPMCEKLVLTLFWRATCKDPKCLRIGVGRDKLSSKRIRRNQWSSRILPEEKGNEWKRATGRGRLPVFSNPRRITSHHTNIHISHSPRICLSSNRDMSRVTRLFQNFPLQKAQKSVISRQMQSVFRKRNMSVFMFETLSS